jgi:hypothetical protein
MPALKDASGSSAAHIDFFSGPPKTAKTQQNYRMEESERARPLSISRSACWACDKARSRVRVMTKRSLGSNRSRRSRYRRVRRSEAIWRVSTQRESCDSGAGDVLVVGGKGHLRARGADEAAASGAVLLWNPELLGLRDPSARRAPGTAAGRTCAVRYGAHKAAPYSCANCRRPFRAPRRRDRTAPVFRLRRRWKARRPGPRPATCQKPAGLRAAERPAMGMSDATRFWRAVPEANIRALAINDSI